MHAISAALSSDPTRHAAALADTDVPADDGDEYGWVGYESAHPVPEMFVVPVQTRCRERTVD